MATRTKTSTSSVAVEPRPDGRWAVQKDGTGRATALLTRKDDAIRRARAVAKREGAELVIKNADGTIASKDSHGHDPRSVKG